MIQNMYGMSHLELVWTQAISNSKTHVVKLAKSILWDHFVSQDEVPENFSFSLFSLFLNGACLPQILMYLDNMEVVTIPNPVYLFMDWHVCRMEENVILKYNFP